MANLLVVTTTSTSLNFLIYVQNLYLSQKEQGKNRFPSYRVPYSIFHENFEDNFRQLWVTVLKQISENPENDAKFFYEEKEVFGHTLCNGEAISTVKFEDIYRTFQNWWGSFAGGFAIERAAGDKMSQLYFDLTNKHEVNLEKITMSILYDDCVFAAHQTMQTMAITSVPEVYRRYGDVVDRVLGEVIAAGD